MACNVFSQIGKNRQKIQTGVFHCLRMCNQEVTRPSSSGQTNDQSEPTYGAPEYFEYNENSFYDIHADTEKYRLPRPSAKKTSNEEKK